MVCRCCCCRYTSTPSVKPATQSGIELPGGGTVVALLCCVGWISTHRNLRLHI
jgi:hypothetical protein